MIERPTLAEMLAPTLEAEDGHPALTINPISGRIAVVPIGCLTMHEIYDACVIHHALNRGLLVVV